MRYERAGGRTAAYAARAGGSATAGAVLFDLDGTLVDSLAGIAATVDAALAQGGRAACDRAVLRGLIGAPLERIFAVLVPEAAGETEQVQRFVASYLSLYGTVGIPATPLFPGIRELLDDCSAAGRRLALVTTKREAVARQVLDACGMSRHFGVVVGGDTTAHHKPHPAPALAALARLEAPANEAVVVGDTTFDVEMGRAAGCRVIGAGWGYQPAADLLAAGAETVVSLPHGLSQLLVARPQ